jgi:hypothetical protein
MRQAVGVKRVLGTHHMMDNLWGKFVTCDFE